MQSCWRAARWGSSHCRICRMPTRGMAPALRNTAGRLSHSRRVSLLILEEGLFYDVFLITPQGEIVYTYKREPDFATNLGNYPMRGTQLALVFRESRMTLESSISDLEHYAPSNEPATFVSAPVIRDGRLLGVVAFQLDSQRIYQISMDVIGLGTTGETTLAKLVGPDEAIYIAPLRRDPLAAMQRKIDLKAGAAPILKALAGQYGGGVELDYAGKRVVAAWRYLPELRWGVVVKMDADEVFAPLYRQQEILVKSLLALMLFAGALAFYFGRRLVLPLKNFALSAGEIAAGNLDKRVDESRSDEIGVLGRAFNRMTENLQVLTRSLEDRIEERTRDLNAANEQLRVAAVTFETHEAILITDASANIIRVNRAFTGITGYSQEEVLGKNPRILSSGRQDKAFYAAMWQQLLATDSWSGEVWDKRKSGQIYPKWLTITAVKDKQGKTTEYVAIFSDITARKKAEDEIRNLAFYDALTGLPNRRLMLDRFRLALSVSARSHQYGAVLFLDMDKFKILNDTLGHDHGDLLLIEVARRIQACVREMDTVARLGGDEFVMLVEEISANANEASQKVALIAEKIRMSLSAPYQLKDHRYHSSPSIGVCLYRGSGESVDDLLKHADLAMYQAKDSGRNAVRFFDPAMQQAVEAHAAIESDLRHAIPGEQLRLHYQIQIDSDHRPLGAEALLRWVHPIRGMISPAQFIPIAEESSLILDIGVWVLNTACQQLVLWGRSEETRDLELAINVSAQQFGLADFVRQVEEAVERHGINPERLKLELTESVVLKDVADVVAKMHALKAIGVKLSLDDFGTGYSSLAYLKKLPLDQIKIDQSFVRDATTDPNDAVMVKTIIDMAQNFRLNVIAEGVETDAQLAFLRKNGCMAFQGYLFSKPVSAMEFEVLLQRLSE
ncbi:MAG: EAL domain-containing protein [Nitrosomonadales bacterium]|nr:EAL domain-containing protein [Nitrosomonadales bacterium]